MAINLLASVNASLLGDGTSTVVSVDFWEPLSNSTPPLPIAHKTPVGVIDPSWYQSGAANNSNSVTATVSGTVVTFTFADPISSTVPTSVSATLLFNA